MKVTFLTVQDDLDCYGLRCLSAMLRAHGVETQILFLGRGTPHEARFLTGANRPGFSDSVLDAIAERCADSDLLGFSVMTLYYEESARLSDFLRERLRKPILWGGIHPICEPAQSLRHADVIFLGEAEDSLVDVVTRLDAGDSLDGVPGVWFRSPGGVQRNPSRPPSRELDRYPNPDISLDGHWVYSDGRLEPLSRRVLVQRTGAHYMTINARGCPLRCTYCCNSQLARHFDWSQLRTKSVGRIIEELRAVRRTFPEIRGVKLSDDAFGDLPVKYIRDFAQRYREEIGLPLGIPGFSPRNLSEEKLAPLVDAGLVYIRLGIQSGSPRIRKLYGRRESNEEVVSAVKLVNRYMPPIERLKLDIITDNPWETEEDTLESIRLLARLPKPYSLAIFSLTLFPGTPLYTKARREGLVDAETRIVYRKHFHNVNGDRELNRVLELFRRPAVIPRRIEELAASRGDPARFQELYAAYERDVAQMPSPPEPSMW